MNKTQTFEDFLRDKHAKNYMGTDDNMSDSFDTWMGNLDIQEVIDFAEEVMWKARIEALEYAVKKLEPAMNELKAIDLVFNANNLK